MRNLVLLLASVLQQRVLRRTGPGIFAHALIHPILDILFGTLLGVLVDGLLCCPTSILAKPEALIQNKDFRGGGVSVLITGTLPLKTDLALSVKLWPAWPPEESPVAVSGIVESVEAMVVVVVVVCLFVCLLLSLVVGLFFRVG